MHSVFVVVCCHVLMYYIMLYNSGMIEAKAKIFSGLVKNYANKVLSLDKLANVDWVGTISCSFL